MENLWKSSFAFNPILVTAIHDGHYIPQKNLPLYKVSEATRLQEEDPYTAAWATLYSNHIVVNASRFMADLNRHRDKAVYLTPDDAWGIEVWQKEPPREIIAEALHYYDTFYAYLDYTLDLLAALFGHFVVLDVHSYNHHRQGANAPFDNPLANPVVNVGTGSVNKRIWNRLITEFMEKLAENTVANKLLDVRENVKFTGGHLARHIHAKYPESGLCLALEFKKIFMDEHRGELYPGVQKELLDALLSTNDVLQQQITSL